MPINNFANNVSTEVDRSLDTLKAYAKNFLINYERLQQWVVQVNGDKYETLLSTSSFLKNQKYKDTLRQIKKDNVSLLIPLKNSLLEFHKKLLNFLGIPMKVVFVDGSETKGPVLYEVSFDEIFLDFKDVGRLSFEPKADASNRKEIIVGSDKDKYRGKELEHLQAVYREIERRLNISTKVQKGRNDSEGLILLYRLNRKWVIEKNMNHGFNAETYASLVLTSFDDVKNGQAAPKFSGNNLESNIAKYVKFRHRYVDNISGLLQGDTIQKVNDSLMTQLMIKELKHSSYIEFNSFVKIATQISNINESINEAKKQLTKNVKEPIIREGKKSVNKVAVSQMTNLQDEIRREILKKS